MAIVAWCCLVLACNTTNIMPPKPTNTVFAEPAKPTSGISLPVVINLRAISQSLNAQYAERYYTDDSYENNNADQLKITVFKREPLVIQAIENNILADVPMRIEGSYQFTSKLLGINVTHQQPFSFNVTVNLQTLPTFDKDWNLKLNSKANIKWDDLPNFSVIGVQVDFQKMFGKIIQGRIDKLTAQLDEEITRAVNLRKLVSDNWKQVTQPFSLDKKTNSWLVIKPRNVFYTQLQGYDSLAKINLGLYSVIEVVSGYKPVIDSSTTLPILYQTNKIDDKVNLLLNTEIKFEQINKLIQEQIAGKPIKLEAKDYVIDILDAQVFAHGDKIMIGVHVNGKLNKGLIKKKIKGIIYLEGTPMYNANKLSITIKDIDLNVKTKDVLLKSASWLANSKLFKNSIESKLEFSIANQLIQAKKLANEAVNKQYSKSVQLSGAVTEIAPTQVYITPNAIRVNIKATGKIGVELSGF
jgi:hypothetical protein